MVSSFYKVNCFIHLFTCILVLLTPTNLNASSVISYQTSTKKTISPQGSFLNTTGASLTKSTSTYGKITFDGTVTEIGDYAFQNCLNVTEITLPNTVTKIGYGAFSNLKSLQKPIFNSTIFVRLPIIYNGEYIITSSVKEIASSAFKKCTGLTGITIPSSVKKIGESAFAYCTNLKAITIPNNVSEIGHCAFWNCNNLTSIFVGPNPPQIDNSTFELVNKKNCKIYVPQGSAGVYKFAQFWKDFENIIEVSESAYSVESNVQKLTATNRVINFHVNKQAELKNISFDVILPQGLTIENSTEANERISRSDASPLLLSSDCEEGIYEIKLSNIKLTDVGGNIHTPENYVFNIFWGNNPKAKAENGIVSYAGDYSTEEAFNLLQESLPRVNVVDLTKVTSVPNGATLYTENPNTLIKSNADLSLYNDHNVIINNTCENLIICDANEFGSDQNFLAEHISYERVITAEWGSMCLPFEVFANGDITFFTSGTVSDGVLILNSSPIVAAGQPAIFKRNTTRDVAIQNNNTTIVVNTQDVTTNPTSIHLFGAFSPTRIEEEGAYYIANDKCWLKTEGVPLSIKPFRAWFTIGNSSNSKIRSLSIEEEQAAGLNAVQFILENKVLIYDKNGNLRPSMQEGLNIIKLPDGTKQKVLLK